MTDARIATALLLPVILGALFSCGRLACEGFDVPEDRDYEAIRKHLEDPALTDGAFSLRQHDAVAVLPAWSLRPWAILRGMSPLSGDLLGEYPLDRYRRLFVLVEPDGEEALERLVAAIGPPADVTRHGRVALYRFSWGEPRVLYDFRENLSDARVRITDGNGGELTRCDRPIPRGWQCAGRPTWQKVQDMHLLVTENGTRGIWAHPPAPGERLELHYPVVTLGDRLVVRAGHTRDAVSRKAAPVALRVIVNGTELPRIEKQAQFHFQTIALDTNAFAGEQAAVTFIVDTANNGGNHFAFDAWVARDPVKANGESP